MKLIIDSDSQQLTLEQGGTKEVFDLYSKSAFELISRQWVKIGWNQKYTYTFSWLGRPIIQLPEDMLRLQEVVYRIKPDVIVETGVAHGGSLIFYASLLHAIGRGRVIGIDIEIRPHNRNAIEAHELFCYITLVEGSSTDPGIVKQVSEMIKPDERVLVILDSNHTRKHVFAELTAYHCLVTPGSYLVATDGIATEVYDSPRGKRDWAHDNPISAVREFMENHAEFIVEQPPWPFSESNLDQNVTHWPSAWLKRL